MNGVAIAVGCCCLMIFIFTAGVFLGLYASGKLPEKQPLIVEAEKKKEKISSRPTREEQLKNLLEYGGDLSNGQ